MCNFYGGCNFFLNYMTVYNMSEFIITLVYEMIDCNWIILTLDKFKKKKENLNKNKTRRNPFVEFTITYIGNRKKFENIFTFIKSRKKCWSEINKTGCGKCVQNRWWVNYTDRLLDCGSRSYSLKENKFNAKVFLVS